MKNLFLVLLLILTACGGTLTDEQKKKIKDEMENGTIKRLSEADITEASFAYGRNISRILEKKDFALINKVLIDSLENVFSVRIFDMKPGDSLSRKVENEIIEAYTTGSGSFELSDNVQRISEDSVLYTKPFMKERPDGSLEFNKAIGIRIAKKQIILSIK